MRGAPHSGLSRLILGGVAAQEGPPARRGWTTSGRARRRRSAAVVRGRRSNLPAVHSDGQRHLVVGSPVAHGGRPRISPLAISRISARIHYRRGQRAVSKWRNNGSLPSREYLLANEPLFLLSHPPTAAASCPRRWGPPRPPRPWARITVLSKNCTTRAVLLVSASN